MTPEQFSKAIRKDIPLDNFSDDYKNVKGQSINIEKIAADLDKDYTFLYKNYIKDKKMSLEKIKKTEEFKDTEVLLIMKREGKLDNLVNDKRALIQYRNLKTGLLDPKNY